MTAQSATYSSVLTLAQQLDFSDQVRLMEDLALLVRSKNGSANCRSLLELRGLGKEIWRGIDVQTYVEQERAAWIG